MSAVVARMGPASATSPGGREFYGTLVEQFAALELVKQQSWTATPFELYHYRDQSGLEVDLVAETADGVILAIEVKSGRTVHEKAWANLKRFRQRLPDRTVIGILLHGGDATAHLHGWLHVLPIPTLWRH